MTGYPPDETDSRLSLEGTYDFEEGVIFAVLNDGGVAINVTEEQAVDSYNDSFTCTASLTVDQAVELRDWLVKMIK